MTITPSTSPKIQSPGAIGTPPHSTGTSIAFTSPRPLLSSGPMAPAKTGKRISRIRRTSRTMPVGDAARRAARAATPW